MNGKGRGGAAGLGERLFSLLFPARCLLCGKIILPGESLCESCEARRPKTPYERRFSLEGAGAEGFRVISPLSYVGGFRQTLYRFKFRGKKALAKPLGQLMAESLREEGGAIGAVTWVPMTKKGKRRRGYDQSELLAKEVAKILGIPCLPLLEKIRETATQHELPHRKRLGNVKNAYRASGEAAGKVLLLVDDIVTTGSTLRECAGELYRAGAVGVLGLCAADTPEIMMERETEL